MGIPDVVWQLLGVVVVTLLLVLVLTQSAQILTARTERLESRTTRFYLDDRKLWTALIPKSEVRRFWRRHLVSLLWILGVGLVVFAWGAQSDLIDHPLFVVGLPTAVCTVRTWQIFRQQASRETLILLLEADDPVSARLSKLRLGMALFFLITFGAAYYFKPPSGMLLMYSIIFCCGAALRVGLGWEISVYSNGLYQAGSFIPWEQVTWYRWFEKRNGVLFGTGGNLTSDHPFVLLDISAVFPDETERLLEEFLPEKRLPDVETVRDELRASQELTRT